MAEKLKLLAINPGSTSTKIAVFEGEDKVFDLNITHDAEKLKEFAEISDQFDYRKDMIMDTLKTEGYAMEDFDGFVGRGGGQQSCEGGTYEINDVIIANAKKYDFHPATLGPLISDALSREYGKRAFIVNPPDVDEFEPVSRISGLADICRESRIHALSQKEVGLKAAATLGKKYEECNFVIAHIGGGISVAAHKKGKMVDGTDILNGDCPMSPTRAGTMATGPILDLAFSGKYSHKELKTLLTKDGGVVNHLGTSDIREVKAMIADGDKYAELVYHGLIHQIAKSIGSFAAVLEGRVDRIVLTGGIVYDENLVKILKEKVGFIADFVVYPGEFEMEALANGAARVLQGIDEPKVMTYDLIWKGFDQFKTK